MVDTIFSYFLKTYPDDYLFFMQYILIMVFLHQTLSRSF